MIQNIRHLVDNMADGIVGEVETLFKFSALTLLTMNNTQISWLPEATFLGISLDNFSINRCLATI